MSSSMITKLSVAAMALASSAQAFKGDHFYRTSQTDNDAHIANMGYKYEGVAGHLWNTNVASDKDTIAAYDLKPVIRYQNGKEHFYTTNPAVEHLGGYQHEGVVFYIAGSPGKFCDKEGHIESVPLHRCYSGQIGDHLYTTHPTCENAGSYKYEGVLGHVCPQKAKQSKDCPLKLATEPLHRYYMP